MCTSAQQFKPTQQAASFRSTAHPQSSSGRRSGLLPDRAISRTMGNQAVLRMLVDERRGSTRVQPETPAPADGLVAALTQGEPEMEWSGEDVVTAQTPLKPVTAAPAKPPAPAKAPAPACKFAITYANEHAKACAEGKCGAKIVFDATKVTATGAGCPATLDGLMLTEVVTNDHGCTPAEVKGGGGCPIAADASHKHEGTVDDCTDTYGVCLGAATQARMPAGGCTETITQQLFVGGVLAETHTIRFPISKTATGCTGEVHRT